MEGTKVRRVCVVCKTKKFRKSGGGLVCKYGHQVLDYQVEEGDDERITGRERKRIKTIKNVEETGYSPLEQKSNWIKICYYTLRVMARCMVQELGFPPAVETTARKLWLMYISNSQRELADAYLFGLDDNSDNPVNDKVKEESMSDPEALLEESETESETEEEEPERVQPKPAKAAEQTESGTITTETSSAREARAARRAAAVHTKEMLEIVKKHNETSKWKTGSKWPTLSFIDSLAFLYLACLYLELPVVAGDFVRWSKTGQLPYLDMQRRIPEDILTYTGKHGYRMTLIPRSDLLMKKTRVYALCFKQLCKLHFPILNVPLLLNRFCDQFYLPVTGYYFAHYIYRYVCLTHSDDFNKERDRQASTIIMSCVLLTAKLFYGVVDGPSRSKYVSVYNPLLTKERWVAKIRSNLERWKRIDKEMYTVKAAQLFFQGSVKNRLMAHLSDRQLLVMSVLKRLQLNKTHESNAGAPTEFDIMMTTHRSAKHKQVESNSVAELRSIIKKLKAGRAWSSEGALAADEKEEEEGSQARDVEEQSSSPPQTDAAAEEVDSTLSTKKRKRSFKTGEMFYTRNEKGPGPERSPRLYMDLLALGNYILTGSKHDYGLELRLRFTDKKFMNMTERETIDPKKLYQFAS